MSDSPPTSSFSSDSAVLITKALPSGLGDILSRSGPLLARHMAQRAAAMANVAEEAGPSAYILVS
jgi:hypothetical protein